MTAVAAASRAALWAAAVAFGLLLLSSLVRQPLNTAQAAALTVFAALALLRPVSALLLFAGLGPLIAVISAVLGLSFGGTRLLETLALIVIVSWIARQARWIQHAGWHPLDWALAGFATIVIGSAAAHLPAIALRTGDDSSLRALWGFLTRAYLDHPPGFEVITQAVLLLEGLALCALVSRLGAEAASARQIAGMTIAGATGAALLNVYRLFEVALRRGPLTETLAETFRSLRINTQFGDLNAAGSYFAMMLVAAVGLGDGRSRRGAAYLAAVVPLAAAVWLSGSRSAVAGAAAGALGAILLRGRGALVFATRRRMVAAAALVMTLGAALTLLPKARSATVGYSVFARAELARTAFRMFEDRPILGVGVSRFYELFPQYASPELRQAFFESALTPVTRENAHNNFLQILAELGIAGFTGFLLVLWLALRPDRLNVDPTGVRRAMVITVGAFLFTSLFGHPLLTREVAYPFWMLLGLSAAGAPGISARPAATLRLVVCSMVVVLVAIMPVRAGYERRHANLEGVALGMSNWQRDESGNRFRWAGEHSTLFLAPGSGVVKLPMRATSRAECAVEIRIDGRAVDRVTVPRDFWQEVRLRLPESGKTSGFYRVDLIAGAGCADGEDARPTLMIGLPAM